jgi:hypothetical protein
MLKTSVARSLSSPLSTPPPLHAFPSPPVVTHFPHSPETWKTKFRFQSPRRVESPWFHPYLQTSGGAVFFPVGLGKDHPFRIRRVKRPEFQWQGNEGDLRYGQLAPSAQVLSSGVPQAQPYPSVTEAVLNEDEPIPLGDRSQWIRAVTLPTHYTSRLQSKG